MILNITPAILFTFATAFLYPQGNQSEVHAKIQQINLENQHVESPQTMFSNQILHLMNHIEAGELAKNNSPADLDKLIYYLGFLEQEEDSLHNPAKKDSLQEDVEELHHREPYHALLAQHGFLKRLFRTCYFRLAVISDGLFERILNTMYLSMTESVCNPPLFNESRAEYSLGLFRQIGANIKQVIPRDNNASVQMMHLRACEFEEILKTFGAVWEKRMLQINNYRLVEALVISNSNPTSAWRDFQSEVLAKFGWIEKDLQDKDGQIFRGIITSKHADFIPEEAFNTKMIMFCHSPSTSFVHDRKRAAYYLGLKQDVCMYDSRGIWKSQGYASEAGFYLDAQRVFDELIKQEEYLFKDIWVGGKCSGAQVAAHLKAKYHTNGINFFAEGSFINTSKDFISSLDPISQWVYKMCLPSIRMQGNAKELYGIEEVDFDIEGQWKFLSTKNELGKIVLIHADNDQRVSAESFADFEALALKVNSKVTNLVFHSDNSQNPHADSAIFYESIKRDFARCIFSSR